MVEAPGALTIGLQLAAGAAAIARIRTDDYRRSRAWAIAAQTAIGGDYLIKSIDGGAADLAGLVYSTLVTMRTALVLFVPVLDRLRAARVAVCLVFLAWIWGLLAIVAIAFAAAVGVITALPFLAALCGAGTDISNNQTTRRWLFLALGLSQVVFAIATRAWGLAAKSLISDVGASLVYLRRPT